jgi:hypothetical protein
MLLRLWISFLRERSVAVVPNGYLWRETAYASLSTIARPSPAQPWSGPRFFGLRSGGERAVSSIVADVSSTAPNGRSLVRAAN